MNDKVTLTIEKLRELCPTCADRIVKDSLTKGIKLSNVSIKKSDYFWLTLKKDEQPPKDWFDNCVETVSDRGDVDDPEAMCAYVWQQHGGDDEAQIPDTEDAMDAIKQKMANDECMGKLRKDIETVLCWRKFGKALNPEQQRFADRVADEMIAFRVAKQVGVQLVSGDNIRFIKKGMEMGNDAGTASGITQDAVAIGPAQKDKAKMCFHTGKCTCNEVAKVAKPSGEKPKEVPASAPESGNLPRKTADIKNGKQDLPDGQKEGEVNAVIDSKVDPKQLSPDDKGEIAIEELGHQPNLPMPKKMAEELISNAKWGVEIGAYGTVKEGIDRLLGTKAYAEFIDTDDKLKEVIGYLTSLNKE